jgi:hypothetical protein
MKCVKANLPCAEANCFFPCTPIFGSPKKCHECLYVSVCREPYKVCTGFTNEEIAVHSDNEENN